MCIQHTQNKRFLSYQLHYSNYCSSFCCSSLGLVTWASWLMTSGPDPQRRLLGWGREQPFCSQGLLWFHPRSLQGH